MNKKWYTVPPYKNEGWRIVNEKGELVATFEQREDCEMVTDLANQREEYDATEGI
jgi:hypothetical protein